MFIGKGGCVDNILESIIEFHSVSLSSPQFPEDADFPNSAHRDQ